MFLDLLKKRRSIRRFTTAAVEREKIELLVEAALRAPSSRGLNPWHFVVVTDQALRAALAKAKPHGGSFIAEAPLAIVVCADPQKCDVWVEDASIAALVLHLAATDLGLGSCWVQIRLRDHHPGQTAAEHIAGLLGLPAGMEVEAMIAIGYPQESKPAHPKDSLPYGQVSYEKFVSTP